MRDNVTGLIWEVKTDDGGLQVAVGRRCQAGGIRERWGFLALATGTVAAGAVLGEETTAGGLVAGGFLGSVSIGCRSRRCRGPLCRDGLHMCDDRRECCLVHLPVASHGGVRTAADDRLVDERVCGNLAEGG